MNHHQRTNDVNFGSLLEDQVGRLFDQTVSRGLLEQADRGVWSEELWRCVVEAGIPSMLLKEESGGIGASFPDAMRVVRLAASRAVPLPIAETVIGAGYWASLASPVDGAPITIAPRVASSSDRLVPEAGSFRLDCTAARVPWGRNADSVLLVFQSGDSAMLVLAPAKDAVVERGSNLAGEPRDKLTWTNVRLPGDRVVPIASAAAEALFMEAALAKAEQLVGAMKTSLRLAIDYAIERRQFGQPIARFQAIQHLLAESAGELAAATAAVDNASASWRPDGDILAPAVAKARASAAAGKVAATAHQVLGAIGYTHEHQLHYSTRRLWAWRDECGSDAYWEAKIGRAVCAAGSDALWNIVVCAS